jgi:hypothetical protein
MQQPRVRTAKSPPVEPTMRANATFVYDGDLRGWDPLPVITP